MTSSSCSNSTRLLARILVLVASLIAASRTTAAAQPQFAAGGTVGFATAGHRSSDNRLTPNLDGSAPAGVFFVDRVIRPRISVGAEMSISSEIKGLQEQRASGETVRFRSRHHDTIGSGVIKVNVLTWEPQGRRPDARVQLEGVVGAGVAWRHTLREGVVLSPPPFGRGVDQDLSNIVFAATVGFDAVFVISPHAAVLLATRYHVLADHDLDSSGLPLRGVGSTVYGLGFGTRFRF